MLSRSSLVLGLVATGSLVAAGPCDIYAAGGTPCVAAHSTTRSLLNAYIGPLYQVQRGSDSATADINALVAGGVANATAQDAFCAGTTCVITIIYDQTQSGNRLTQAPPGGAASGPEAGGLDSLASAIGAPVTLNGQKAYGVFISPGTGYRNNAAVKIATGDAAEGMYAVLDGTHFNGACCFDYGNAETNSRDNNAGHMEALYFGSAIGTSSGVGSGPWVMADLENGLFAGNKNGQNPSAVTNSARFATGILKGEANNWSLRGGNAASGGLTTYFAGTRPSGYNPMSKEGAIILGIGGDNSDGAQGTFYEGVMTSGYPSDATENSVQANIVAAKYATTSLVAGPGLTVGSSISLRATTACCTADYISHSGSTVSIQAVTSSSSAALKGQASWVVRTGLGNSACYSFESKDTPGSFLRHSGFQIFLNANDGSKLFSEDATYCPQAGLNGQGNSIRSWSYPAHWFRHFNGVLYAAANGGPATFDAKASFNDDASFVIGASFA